MHPEILQLPFIHASIKSYGLMIVIGLLAAIFVVRRLSDRIGIEHVDKDHITNGALYALIAGVLGSRIFYVVHHFGQFRGNLISVFSIWEGGLELLGGVLLALAVIFGYLLMLKLPVRRYFDILAIALTLTLGFGRIGCFLNGCCWGKPTTVPWGVTFPYGSLSYASQAFPDIERGRSEPYINIPNEYFGTLNEDGRWVVADPAYKYYSALKPVSMLTPEEKQTVSTTYCALKVHPTQIYESLAAFCTFGLLYSFWYFVGYGKDHRKPRFAIGKPGTTFALMFICYGIWRFCVEFLRDDNPFEMIGLTISQLISTGLVAFAVILFFVFAKMRTDDIALKAQLSRSR